MCSLIVLFNLRADMENYDEVLVLADVFETTLTSFLESAFSKWYVCVLSPHITYTTLPKLHGLLVASGNQHKYH